MWDETPINFLFFFNLGVQRFLLREVHSGYQDVFVVVV